MNLDAKEYLCITSFHISSKDRQIYSMLSKQIGKEERGKSQGDENVLDIDLGGCYMEVHNYKNHGAAYFIYMHSNLCDLYLNKHLKDSITSKQI